ncbi:MAG TPA: carboxypeptidase regulatory-like domain-containing protein [Gemmatimonadaceae bacterium]|nr:carboxypeptidase regulatory-like domain-containing protein [Gemmatimonadaceae bacterium]
MRIPLLPSVILASVLASVGQAQQASPATSTAVAVGTVYDSVRLKPMSGARIRLDTSSLVATADESGKFRLEGIPPGQHFLRVEHPMADTLAIVLRSETQDFAGGESKEVDLATPSSETLVAILCAPAWRARGPSALMGTVREADTGVPAVGAKVSLVWYELDIANGIRKTPRVREATIGKDGVYRICGLPKGIDGKLQVIRGPLTSGDIPLEFGDDVLALRSMTIASPSAVVAAPNAVSDSNRSRTAAPSAPVLGSARLTGRVLNKTGQPLPGARVQLENTTRVATTRTNGEFVLDSLPPGTQTVSVRLLGYQPVEQAVDLSSRDARSVTMTLDNFVPVLEAVRVSAQRERALDDVGFARRKRTGMGWYLDGDALASKTTSTNFSDVMRGAPGIRVEQAGNGRQVITSSRDPANGCVNIWVDGTQWQQLDPGDVDDFVKPYELGAVEVYSSSNVPVEYQPAGRGNCTTIVAWTKRKLDQNQRRTR